MTPSVQVGTILIGEESPRMAEVLALESEPYFENWGVVKPLDGLTLDKKIHAAGSNFFFSFEGQWTGRLMQLIVQVDSLLA